MSTTDLDDDALEASLMEEDIEHGRTAENETANADDDEESESESQAGSDTPAAVEGEGKEEEEAKEPAAEAAAAQAEPTPAKPAGVLGKDGKTVLPYAALKGARDETKAERRARLAVEAERDELRQQVATLKAGKTAEPEVDPLEELVADFPATKPLVEKLKAQDEQLQQMREKSAPAAKAAPAEPDNSADTVQDAIDSVPMLAEWQAADPEKWARAVAIDNALKGSRKWADKPQAERFAHVARQVADEYDIQIEETPAASPAVPPKNRKDPDEVIKGAARNAPNTLSDFKGGAPDATKDDIDRLPAASQVSRAMKMTDAQLDAWAARGG